VRALQFLGSFDLSSKIRRLLSQGVFQCCAALLWVAFEEAAVVSTHPLVLRDHSTLLVDIGIVPPL
jgi:hypothetical protein